MTQNEIEEYFGFTGPSRLSRAIHTLEGLLLGIVIDHKINDRELVAFSRWIQANAEFSKRHPFDELIPLLRQALTDGTISEEERADLLWCCGKFTSKDGYYADTTANMQRLQGILSGVVADGHVSDEEARNLSAWMADKEDLKTVWPYAEIDSLLTSVLSDGVIDKEEQHQLLDLFAEFSGTASRPNKPSRTNDQPRTVQGICACNPEIVFPNQMFCLTGESERWTKSEFSDLIDSAGAKYHPRVIKSLNYLVVGGGGNPCWAYSCYGRKIEQATNLRKQGLPMLIVHEYDIWDALQDLR